MRTLVLTALAALTAVGCARGPNVTTAALPLTRVVVYRNGVGYFERAGSVEADEVTFKMRQRMVGDFLATLAIVERGGSSVRSASFPLDVAEDEAEPPVQPDQGVLKPWPLPPPPKGPKDRREVVLRLDGKEHDLAIGYVVETPVWRPSYRVVVRPDGKAVLQMWGIVQNLSGEDWSNVELALVAGAPLAFESTLGDPVVPTRPIVTDSGEVIAAVPGSVTSLQDGTSGEVDRFGGDAPAPAPAAAAPAAEPSYDYDEGEAKPSDKKRVAISESSTIGRGAGPGTGQGYGSGGGRKDSRARPPAKASPASVQAERHRIALEEARQAGPSAPRNLSALAAVAVDTGTTRYKIPERVTVPDGSATMVLLLNQDVPGEMVFLFSPDGGVPDSTSHPFRVARFQNSTKGLLERGPITVFERGSFLGQGMVDPLPPGAKATVPFALERSLAVEVNRKYEQQGARIAQVEAGSLVIERDGVTKTIYAIKNGGDELAKLLVRHSRSPGTRLHKPLPGTEDNTGTGYALVPVEVKGKGRAELTVDERIAQNEGADWLSPLADEAVRAYLADPRADKATVAKLTEAWKLRETLRRSTDEAQKLRDEQAELERATRETRLSLSSIEKNTQAADLRVKLTRRLAEFTSRLEQITKRLIELDMAINEQQVRFRDAILEVKIAAPLPPLP